MANIKIKIKGMHCASCEILLKEALEGLPGINNAEAHHKSGVVSVDFDNKKVKISDIVRIIKNEGYGVV